MSSERWGALLHLNVISVLKLQMRPLCLNLEHGDPAASSPQKPQLIGTKFLTTKATWAISYCIWELEFTALGLNSDRKFPIGVPKFCGQERNGQMHWTFNSLHWFLSAGYFNIFNSTVHIVSTYTMVETWTRNMSSTLQWHHYCINPNRTLSFQWLNATTK